MQALAKVKDTNLQHTLQFGIGLHHAALPNADREVVEELFCTQKIQVLVATSTLAWGVNTPAHLVIIKGTEFFDGKTKRYVDLFPDYTGKILPTLTEIVHSCYTNWESVHLEMQICRLSYH
jgi:Helicase conserved C-terminal domain